MLKGRHARLRFRVVWAKLIRHPNAPHSIQLLRHALRAPCDRRAAEKLMNSRRHIG